MAGGGGLLGSGGDGHQRALGGLLHCLCTPGTGLFPPDYGALYVLPTFTGSDPPAATRGGATWKQEGGIWGGITAQGCAGDLPPLR